MTEHVFTSTQRGLTLQDSVDPKEGSGVWAQFVDGVFVTDDADVAARLRKVDSVTEVPEKAQAVTEAEQPAGTEQVPLVLDMPDAKASKAKWKSYATSHGMTAEDAERLTARELAEHFLVGNPRLQDSPGQAIVPGSQTPAQADAIDHDLQTADNDPDPDQTPGTETP